jgi:DNA (cytosine-5)-methyltransferase 3A
MNILSLFDGMSCGQIALNQLGFKIDNYFASEIDKDAMKIAKKNFPNIIHIGDVTRVKGNDLPKIDLLMGGSPCQGFSFAGKQLNFNDPRSALFFEFVRLLKETNPKYFLLENVRMKIEYQDVITKHLNWIEPIAINSSLVSAQNRNRLYWTNIPNVEQPEDKGILLKDILELVVDDKYNLSKVKIDRVLNTQRGKGFFYSSDTHNKIGTLIAGYHKMPTDGAYIASEKIYTEPYYKPNGKTEGCVGFVGNSPKQATRVFATNGKSVCLTALGGGQGGKTGLYEIPKGAAIRGRYLDDGSIQQQLELRKDNKTNTLTTVQKDNVIVESKICRKLTPTECEKLQTVPSGYTEGVSNTSRYKMLGNGWTVDVIAHILKNMEI